MSYCTVDQVCSGCPPFRRNAAGSVSDDEITNWVDQATARIRSVLMSRGIDPDALTLTDSQTNWLALMCEDYAASKLMTVLESASTSQGTEFASAAQRRKAFEDMMKQIEDGLFDRFFSADAAIIDTGAGFLGIGGAETDPTETTTDRGENRAFSRADVY